MEVLYWNGPDSPALLYNGGALWDGEGNRVVAFDLPPVEGDPRQGWYHCIPADVRGDAREEAVLFNPWADAVYVFTPPPLDEPAWQGYNPGPRQYNARLMD